MFGRGNPIAAQWVIDFAPLVLISKDIYQTWYKKVGLLDKSSKLELKVQG